MNNINFIFLRSLVTADVSLINKNKENYLKELNKNNDFIFDEKGTEIFFIESGGTEGIFKSVFMNYKEPYILLAKDSNNSLPAALEIATFLKRNNKRFSLIHGTIDDVRKSLISFKEQEAKKATNPAFLPAKLLQNQNYGVIGKPSDWLISSNVDYKLAKEKFGVNLIDISTSEFLENISDKYDVNLFEKFKVKLNDKISEQTLVGALKIYNSLKALIFKYKLSGLTVRCFDLLTSVRNTSCLALALLNEEGIVATCEGDVPTMLTMAYVKSKFNQPSFQVNPSYVNLNKRYAYFAHCTLPLNMCNHFLFDSHYESGIGIGIKGKLSLKDVTIFKINADLEHFEIFEGRIIENLNFNNLCRTQIKVSFDEDISEILSSPNGNHLIVFYGKHKNEII